jgi:hypothetical protein
MSSECSIRKGKSEGILPSMKQGTRRDKPMGSSARDEMGGERGDAEKIAKNED